MRYRADYTRHEYIYAARPEATGWNTPETDQQALAWARELLARARLAPPARILELGCGMGALALGLALEGFRVAGADISPTAIAAARRRAAALGIDGHFAVGDITAPSWRVGPFATGAFDAVLDGLCWHCMIGSDRATFLRAARGALQPGGALLVMTMCGDPRSARLAQRFDPVSRYVTDGEVAERYLGLAASLRAELARAGFAHRYERVEEGDDATGDQDMYLAVAQSQSTSQRARAHRGGGQP